MPWPADLRHVPSLVPGRHPRPAQLRALVSCEAVAEELPLVVDGSRRPSEAMAEHLRSCLSCQAELAGYRRLLRVLRGLREEHVGDRAPVFGEDTRRALADCIRARSRAVGRWRIAGAAALALAALGGGAALARAAHQTRLLAGGAAVV